MPRTKRKRGAQKGNRNALKHGCYSRAVESDREFVMADLADVSRLGEDIALLRSEIKKAVLSGDERRLVPLAKTAESLCKLIRAYNRLCNLRLKIQDNSGILAEVLQDVLYPLAAGPENKTNARFEAVRRLTKNK